MIAVIDYEMGNIRSVQKAFERLGTEANITDDPKVIENAAGVVLPGVGAFGAAMTELKRKQLCEPIRRVIEKDVPFLGICLGLQLLFERSYEEGEWEGLGVFKGAVVRFGEGIKVPHIGWNQVEIVQQEPFFDRIPGETFYYFVHSYYVVPAEPSHIAATCNYGVDFCCAVQRGNLFAVQFHPEKSQKWGARILQNFLDVVAQHQTSR